MKFVVILLLGAQALAVPGPQSKALDNILWLDRYGGGSTWDFYIAKDKKLEPFATLKCCFTENSWAVGPGECPQRLHVEIQDYKLFRDMLRDDRVRFDLEDFCKKAKQKK